jgi:predicted PurR-regulated permease PerM
VLKFLYNLLIGIIVAVYLLGSRKKFARQSVLLVRSTLKPKWANLVLEEAAFVDRMFGGFIDGKIVDSGIIGLLCYLGCLIFKFPNPLLTSAIVGITNVIPFFGPFIGAVPATLLILIESPVKALWFVLFVFVLQQLDGNVIGPAILGDRTGVSSFWVLFSIILFGGLWGIVGMVIAVPLFAVIYDLITRMVHRGLIRHNQIEIWEQYKADYPDEEPKKK